MPRLLLLDPEPEIADSLGADFEVVTGETGYRSGLPLLQVPPHEVDAIVCDLRSPACFDSTKWGPGQNDNYQCTIVDSPTTTGFLRDGRWEPHYKIIQASQMPAIPRGSFGPNDIFHAISRAGVPLLLFFNPEWLRHVAYDTPNFFGIRWRTDRRTASRLVLGAPLLEVFPECSRAEFFQLPVQYKVIEGPKLDYALEREPDVGGVIGTEIIVTNAVQEWTLPARAGGEAAVGLSLIPQPHGGALLSGGKPGNPGHNQHTGTYGGIDRTASSAGSGAGARSSDYGFPSTGYGPSWKFCE